ncbi:MAG TPA: S8 family serine peptidase [Bacillales bacterium]|nr:S8 family serine peptidase [Bacillales bacterium]
MKRVLYVVLAAFLFLMTFSFGGFSHRANASGLEVGQKLEQIISKATELSLVNDVTNLAPVQAIVTYQQMPTDNQLQILQDLGLQTRTFSELPMVAIQGTALQMKQLVSSGLEARSIYFNKDLEYLSSHPTGREVMGADKVNAQLGYTGKGVTVAVIDSGIDATHPDLPFGETVIQNVKFLVGGDLLGTDSIYLENVVDTDTTSGHGTHVAGIIAGNGSASDGVYKGVAPDANLVGLGAGEGLNIFWVLASFNYVLEHQEEYNIQVISNSYGTTGEYSPDAPINVASKKAHDSGIVVTFAAGNAGPEQNTLNPLSAAPWVISVAAGTKDKKLADFSSRGVPGSSLLHPDITAPGVNIVSTRAKTGIVPLTSATTDLTYLEPQYLPYYTTLSGTSMATPEISGVVALMLEANPDLTPDEVLNILQNTADPMAGYDTYEVGAGYVNAYEAVQAAASK